MTDLISRQDAIALLEGKVCFGMSDWEAGFDAGIEKAVKALTNMPIASLKLDKADALLGKKLEAD